MAEDYEIVARHLPTHSDTPITLAPIFWDRKRAEAWIADYKAANPDWAKNGAVEIVARVKPPERKF
jgi:hypothetical protein